MKRVNNKYIKYINKELYRPISSIDIEDILNDRCRILLYPELINYDTIDDLFDNSYDCVVILYMQNKIINGFYGHWCCIFKIDDGANTIEFFDPYGKFCDDQLNYKINLHFRKENGLEYPILSYLLFYTAHGYKLTFNEHTFQGPNVSTCGRHVCCRLLNNNMSLKKYKKFMDSFNINYDLLVTILTDNILTNNI